MLFKDTGEEKSSFKKADAPAVVGQIQVSDELLDFSAFAKPKKKETSCKESGACSKDEENLTPRERAIRARKEGK